MNTLLKTSIVGVTLFAFFGVAHADTDGQLLTQCKVTVKAQLDDVKRIKLANLKNQRNTFQAKLKIMTADDRSVYLCTIKKNQKPQLVRIDKAGDQLAAGQ